MKIAVLKSLRHDKLGLLRRGWVGEMPDEWARRFIAQGAAEAYETKVARERPLPDAGADIPSPASPAAPASRQTIALPSKRGATKRGKRARSS